MDTIYATKMDTKTDTKMDTRSIRQAPPYTLHLIKSKWYVSVNAPNEIRHLYESGRSRRSTSTNDKRIANERASELVEKIVDDFELKYSQLDPFIEACRPFLIKAGFNPTEWYTLGHINAVFRGKETSFYQMTGKLAVEQGDVRVDMSEEEVELDDYTTVANGLYRRGFAVPQSAIDALDSDDREKLLGFLEEKPKVGTLVEMMKDDTGGLDEYGFEKGEFNSDLAGMMLENFDEADHTYFKVEKAPEQTYYYSDLIEPYLDSRSNEASKEVTSRRLACNRVLEYVGDLPLAEYASIHAYDMAKAMDSAGYSNRSISKNITYANGLFRWAKKNRDELGRQYLNDLPWRDLELAEFGKEKRSYLPLSEQELFNLFSLKMEHQEKLLLSMLITTGMRLDEAALMTWERITEKDGVLCFSLVNDDENVLVKNRGSMRYIPVPNALKPVLGNGGEGRLFKYRKDRDGKAQAKASDAVMPYIRQVTQNDRKVAHSLRGNFKDLIRDLEVSKEINDFITGHAAGDVAGKYGQGPSMNKRLEVINKIQHPWLI